MPDDSNTIFWSWQDDLTPAHHHFLVRDALQDAADRVADANGVDDAPRPEIDHDTRGVAGSPEIVATIHRKIEEAAVFVADMTPVGATDPALNRPRMDAAQRPPPKLLQNPNVMDELGRADHALGAGRILLIANTHYYPGPEALPFDWRHRRGPITYTLPPEATGTAVRAARATLAAALIEPLRLALSAATAARPAPPPVLQRAPSTIDPAIWSGAESGVTFNAANHSRTRYQMHLKEGPRIYVRIRAENWPGATRVELQDAMIASNVYLWVHGGSGWTGMSSGGAFAANGGTDDGSGTYTAGGFTQWFADDGEIWATDTISFLEDESGGGWAFSYRLPIPYIAQFLRNAVRVLHARAPQGRIEIEIGASGLTNSYIVGGYQQDRISGLADRVSVRRADTNWPAASRNALLLDFWNQIMDVYGGPAAADVEALERVANCLLSGED